MAKTAVQHFLTLLREVKPHKDYWAARCPGHDDGSASLSVREGQDGKVVVKCFAGCSYEQIRDSLGLEDWNFFFPPGKRGEPLTVTGPGKSKVSACYDYTDADGTLIYQVVRYEPKEFKIRRPDGSGGWIWSLGNVTKILYHFPEVIEARERGGRIFLCEGEKDTDNLRALGCVATTNSGGVKSWDRAYSFEFKNAEVVLLPDNDESGKGYTQKAAAQIFEVAASVKVIELPNLPVKGDITNWLEAGGNKEELEKLIENTPPWKPSHNPKADSYHQNFEIDKIEKVGKQDAVYHVHVFGHVVEMSVDDLNSFSLFTKKVMEIADRRPDMRNTKDWGPYLDMCMQERLEKIESPDDANEEAMIWHHVCRYMSTADEKEDSFAEKRRPWSNEKYIYFHGPSLHHYLHINGLRIPATKLWDVLRLRGAINKPKRATDSENKDHVIKAWLVEKASVTDEVGE